MAVAYEVNTCYCQYCNANKILCYWKSIHKHQIEIINENLQKFNYMKKEKKTLTVMFVNRQCIIQV